jgi:hypothetical protein
MVVNLLHIHLALKNRQTLTKRLSRNLVNNVTTGIRCCWQVPPKHAASAIEMKKETGIFLFKKIRSTPTSHSSDIACLFDIIG